MRISALGETFIQDGMVRSLKKPLPYKEIPLTCEIATEIFISVKFQLNAGAGLISVPYLASANCVYF